MTSVRYLLRALRVPALAAILALALVACGEDEPVVQAQPGSEPPVEVLYNSALDDLVAQDYEVAAAGFDTVERQYPYSVWATKAQLMAIFAYYMTNEYDLAIGAAERFIRLHPGSKEAPYAHYMIAISHYEQIADVNRDQGRTREALAKLEEVIRRYPRSSYAQDAQAKLALTQDHLAGKQMAVGRYYLERGHYVAAINRFQNVVEEYQTTSHTPEALHRLVESYLSLGVTDEAQAVAAVLGHNYARSPWYRDSYALLQGQDLEPEAREGSWISRVWNSIF
ncbi:MAG: outer membrane protein assembly factor BamD [Minwuia sp.]|uniref:outer membrane protein assembly factor BamD n=1 Tax=Minwuia sp. TaxID=2493630 RepID=UPI003A897F40